MTDKRTNEYVRLIGLQTPIRNITSNIRFGSPCKLLSGVPPTNFASFYLCISALMSERTYEYVRLIGLQTLVRTSFYYI
ncbi:hypothetical protein T07_11123 [Trichinella nelsoni]|uniref:Uncharacterized protein n=1 Tax=Trichinella nelsoni TaxID=6336 RepID=A0A0V0RDV6_9BILA|nr:hypothetical protein T07_11123 [Trichinella nelsoni]